MHRASLELGKRLWEDKQRLGKLQKVQTGLGEMSFCAHLQACPSIQKLPASLLSFKKIRVQKTPETEQ